MKFPPPKLVKSRRKRKRGNVKPARVGKSKSSRTCHQQKLKVKIGNKIQLINCNNRQLQPVVLLRNIFAGYTLTKIKTGNNNKSEAKAINRQYVWDNKGDDSCNRREPVVVLVDCLNSSKLSKNEKLGSDVSTTAGLTKLGLCDFKLSQVVMKPDKLTIDVNVITQFLVDAVSLGNAPNRHNRPFDLSDPQEECLAIVEALSIYANCVPPLESLALFCSSSSNSISCDVQCSVPVSQMNHEGCLGESGNFPTKSRSIRKGWVFVTTLGNSDFFVNLRLVPGRKHAFEKKMLAIMKAGMEVDPYNWTLSEVGYILGFWLAKMYNSQGIPDENLPKELVLAKEHFLELRGWHYDDVTVVK